MIYSGKSKQSGGAGKGEGILYVVATPIGNLEDITLRGIRILREADIIASEDTRHTRKLLSHFGISTKLISYYKEKEITRAAQIIEMLKQGHNVALVSDAGTPGISDPGGILVEKARATGLKVTPIPGPSALTAAFSVAGIEKSPFIFLGFLPSRPNQRRKLLKSLIFEQKNIIFYESPHRLISCLQDCLKIFGDQKAFWARELTKIHEELRSDYLSALIENNPAQKIVKGESVVIITNSGGEKTPKSDNLADLLRWHREHTNLSLKDTVQKIAADLGQPRTKIYQEALKVWHDGGPDST